MEESDSNTLTDASVMTDFRTMQFGQKLALRDAGLLVENI
jgi:hypothetical protein